MVISFYKIIYTSIIGTSETINIEFIDKNLVILMKMNNKTSIYFKTTVLYLRNIEKLTMKNFMISPSNEYIKNLQCLIFRYNYKFFYIIYLNNNLFLI